MIIVIHVCSLVASAVIAIHSVNKNILKKKLLQIEFLFIVTNILRQFFRIQFFFLKKYDILRRFLKIRLRKTAHSKMILRKITILECVAFLRRFFKNIIESLTFYDVGYKDGSKPSLKVP